MAYCKDCGSEHCTSEAEYEKQDGDDKNQFCRYRGKDKKGFFCQIAALEGYSGCHCGYNARNVKLECCEYICSTTGNKSWDGVCRDFVPTKMIRDRLRKRKENAAKRREKAKEMKKILAQKTETAEAFSMIMIGD